MIIDQDCANLVLYTALGLPTPSKYRAFGEGGFNKYSWANPKQSHNAVIIIKLWPLPTAEWMNFHEFPI